jgi:nucleotide-binding universal stress UspA family protein
MQTPVEIHFEKYALDAADHILVATDLTDTDYLLPHAIAQAKANGAQVTLLHALPPSSIEPMIGPMDVAAIPYIDKDKIVRDLRVTLLGLVRELESQGILCNSTVREGNPTDVISQELTRIHATRLIIGSHGRGRLGQLVLGSVAHQLITEVDVPVFVVGPHARTAVEHVTPRRILHPASFTGEYRASLQLALDVARTYQAELVLIHVLDRDLDESINPQRTIDWAKQALDALASDAGELSPLVHTTAASGTVADEILKAAAKIEADWIVLGADGAFRAWPFHQGSAYKVLAQANCPVLTLRHEPAQNEVAVNLEEVYFTPSF